MEKPKTVDIKGLHFELISDAHPEQYDVTDGRGKPAGYVRLRHGQFRVDYPLCRVETLLSAQVESDGAFETQTERDKWLNAAADAIKERRRLDRSRR